MNTAALSILDTFQLKGSRTIFKLQTTYINRKHSNAYVRTQINQTLKDARCKELLPHTEWHELRIINYLATLISTDTAEPGTHVAFDRITLEPTHHGKTTSWTTEKEMVPHNVRIFMASHQSQHCHRQIRIGP